ncbi:unnamed protein product [Amoebophrya sp. A120]|nr:unnamed protein product [Amoebophrya sp. A120]|eukprot:GSA120T00024439001.1
MRHSYASLVEGLSPEQMAKLRPVAEGVNLLNHANPKNRDYYYIDDASMTEKAAETAEVLFSGDPHFHRKLLGEETERIAAMQEKLSEKRPAAPPLSQQILPGNKKKSNEGKDAEHDVEFVLKCDTSGDVIATAKSVRMMQNKVQIGRKIQLRAPNGPPGVGSQRQIKRADVSIADCWNAFMLCAAKYVKNKDDKCGAGEKTCGEVKTFALFCRQVKPRACNMSGRSEQRLQWPPAGVPTESLESLEDKGSAKGMLLSRDQLQDAAVQCEKTLANQKPEAKVQASKKVVHVDDDSEPTKMKKHQGTTPMKKQVTKPMAMKKRAPGAPAASQVPTGRKQGSKPVVMKKQGKKCAPAAHKVPAGRKQGNKPMAMEKQGKKPMKMDKKKTAAMKLLAGSKTKVTVRNEKEKPANKVKKVVIVKKPATKKKGGSK